MFSRRLSTCLARFVLAWFVLHVGAGVAAPVLNPHALQVVCAGSGLKLVPGNDGDAQVMAGGLDCPLCSPALAPPPLATAVPLLLQDAPLRVVALPRAIPRPMNQAPPPARGPPAGLVA